MYAVCTRNVASIIAMPRHVDSCAHRNGKPFMRVEGDRIGMLDALQFRAQFRNEYRGSAPRSINVIPKILLRSNLGDGVRDRRQLPYS